MVSLGGDGTNRAIVRACSDIDLIPLSTGTNNVFPALTEPTIAGMVAGINCLGRFESAPCALKQAAKVLHLSTPYCEDVGLIDAVLLLNDHVGNLLPFDAQRLDRLVLTRAEPNAIGMSPIGGYIDPVYAEDDVGLVVDIGPGGSKILAPVSPGFYRSVEVLATRRVAFNESVTFEGPGVVAMDGDRDHKINAGEQAYVCVKRDGPQVLNVDFAMRWAVSEGMMSLRSSNSALTK
jgi:hypothetical protein